MFRIDNLLLFLALFFSIESLAQEYWQQEVNYKINVKLNDSQHTLSAYTEIEYINNSPDSLHFLWFHLWPNAYSGNKTAFWKQKLKTFEAKEYFDHHNNPGYIDSLDFAVDGQKAKWEYHPDHVDICLIHLPQILLPGGKVKITTPFFVKIPLSKYSRLGHAKKSYQITQWYPKPAVYDKFGWHEMPYLNMGEFYSEFGSFDVSITLPSDYVVAATGNLQTPSEIEWLNKKSKEKKEKNREELNTYIQTGISTNKTLRYTESNVHDFAWFADKAFYVRKSEIKLPHSGQKVTTWAMFTNHQPHLWEQATTYINDAIYYYSLWNGDYPYRNCTAVEGALSAGAGMEYPTITIIGSSGDARALEEVIMHEVGHNWFYGLWGFNEREFPYLDEGMNTSNQLRYIETKYPGVKMYESVSDDEELIKVAQFFDVAHQEYAESYELAWLLSSRINLNQKISSTSENFHIMNYAFIAYFKAAHAWHYLRNYLGEKEFDRIMLIFYKEWKFKHPYPEDLQNLFEKETGKNLDWFFNDVIATEKTIDYKIKKIRGDNILIKNKRIIASPFQLAVSDSDNGQWHEGFSGKKWLNQKSEEKSMIIIDPEHFTLDVNRRNNTFSKSALFPHSKPFRMQLLGSATNPYKNHLYYMPVVGLNGLNGLMPGVAFYNSFLPPKRFQFLIMPMYGFKNQDLAGNITFRYMTKNNFTYQLKCKQYGFSPESVEIDDHSYRRFEALLNYRLHPDKSNGIWTDFYISYVKLSNVFEINEFLNFYIAHLNRNKLNPYSLRLHFELAGELQKVNCEGTMRINYGRHRKDLDVRMFAGWVDLPESNLSNPYGLSLAGRGGYADYQAAYLFMRRSSGNEINPDLTGRQVLISDGGFVSYLPATFSDWVVSTINLKTSLPGTNFMKLFVNLGIQKNANDCNNSDRYLNCIEGFQYEAGLELSLIPDIFAIYFPMVLSPDLADINNEWTKNYLQKIRFTLKLNVLGPTGRIGDYLY